MKSIKIWPAIDLLGGKCVRLTEGVYGSEKIYSEDPVEMAKSFESAGLKNLHIVDLDGAKSGEIPHFEIIKKIIDSTDLVVQVGGGIRSMETARRYLDLGVSRIIVGSAAFLDDSFLQDLLDNFTKEKIVLGLDVRSNEEGDFEVFVNGWETNSGVLAEAFLSQSEVENILMTDISKDGKLEGPNFDMYNNFVQKFPEKCFIASGGIGQLSDIKKLTTPEVIVGKAIYEGRIEVGEFKGLGFRF